jgi:ATP-dependent DNA ligase
VLPDGRTAFNLIQNATDTGQGSLIFFLFDVVHLDGENLMALPLMDRKARLASLLNGAPNSLRYNDHQIGHGPAFHRIACENGVEGIVSKRINGRYEPDRRTWLKVKCLNREEFVVVGWSDPEGSRHRIGALLLGYYTPDGLIYAGRDGQVCPVPAHAVDSNIDLHASTFPTVCRRSGLGRSYVYEAIRQRNSAPASTVG